MEAPAQGKDSLEDALPLAGESAHEPLADSVFLEPEVIEDGAQDDPAEKSPERELQKLAESLLAIFPLFAVQFRCVDFLVHQGIRAVRLINREKG